MEIEVNSIKDLIDMGITDFMKFIMNKTFSYTNSLSKILDMELVRVRLLRDLVHSDMESSRASNNLFDLDILSRNFVSTFIEEQKILDRQEIIREKLIVSGISLEFS